MPVEDSLPPECAYWCSLLACMEFLRTGTTCFADMQMFPGGSCRAVIDSGMRGYIGRGLVGEDLYTDGAGRFEQALLKKTAALQRAMLEKALRLVKPGGRVVYSTCSILKEENEDVVASLLKSGRCELVPVDRKRYAEVPRLPCAIPEAILVRPTSEYEGFFAAVLRRRN